MYLYVDNEQKIPLIKKESAPRWSEICRAMEILVERKSPGPDGVPLLGRSV